MSPGARRSEAMRTPEGELRIRIAAPPVDGRANKELIAFLSRLLDHSPSSIRVRSGASSRHKVVEIVGISSEMVTAKLP